MKRVLSWIVLLLGANVFYYIACFVERLLVRIIGGAAEAGIAALVILYIVFGSLIFAIFTMGPWFAAHGIVALSQKIWKSNRATRYWVLGVLYGLYYILCIILMIVGILVVSQPFWGYVEAVFMLYFCIALICTGVSCAKEDGPAPSKREQLQAKLNKEIAKEERATAKVAVEARPQPQLTPEQIYEQERKEALRRVFRNAREIYGEGDEFIRRMDEDVKTEEGRERLSQVFRPQTEQARAEHRTEIDLQKFRNMHCADD